MTDHYHRTNINLHQSDYEFLVARYGHGWTEQVREWVKHHVRIERIKTPSPPKTYAQLEGWDEAEITDAAWEQLNAK